MRVCLALLVVTASACTDSQYRKNGGCETCEAGSFTSGAGANTPHTACDSCPAGSFCDGTSVQTPCSMDSHFSAASAASCKTCAVGSFTSGGDQTSRTACDICPAGHSCDGGSVKTLTSCGSDEQYMHTSNRGVVSCKTCTTGSFTSGGDQTTRTACNICPAGNMCHGGSAVTPCGTDSKFSAAGAASCTVCDPGSFTEGGDPTTRTACTICTAGHECDVGAVRSGTAQRSRTAAPCRRTPPHTMLTPSSFPPPPAGHQRADAVRHGQQVQRGRRRELHGVQPRLLHGRWRPDHAHGMQQLSGGPRV